MWGGEIIRYSPPTPKTGGTRPPPPSPRIDAHDWVTIKSDTVIKEPNPGTGTVTAGAVGDICDNIFHGGFFTDILLRNKFIP